MDRRIVALLALALLVIPLVAVNVVEAQNDNEVSSSIVVSSGSANATLMAKLYCTLETGDVVTRYAAFRFIAPYVYVVILQLDGNRYKFINLLFVEAVHDHWLGAFYAYYYGYDFGFIFEAFSNVVMVRVNSGIMCRVGRAETDAVFTDSAVVITYSAPDYTLTFSSRFDGSRAVFEVYESTEVPWIMIAGAASDMSYEPLYGGYAATLMLDPNTGMYNVVPGVVIPSSGFAAVFFNYFVVNVLELYLNGELVGSSIGGFAAARYEYINTTVTTTVTVPSPVPLVRTETVTETATVPRIAITAESSLMLVLFMLLLLALGIVLYYLMKRG